jgi:hypothetical protein
MKKHLSKELYYYDYLQFTGIHFALCPFTLKSVIISKWPEKISITTYTKKFQLPLNKLFANIYYENQTMLNSVLQSLAHINNPYTYVAPIQREDSSVSIVNG